MAALRSAGELVDSLAEALEELRRCTEVVESTSRRSLNMLGEGADLASALALAEPAATRQSLNDALKHVEEIRHEIRLLVFAAGLKQGMSIAELGRQFGFSRQLAARYAKEAMAGSSGS